MFVRYLFIFLYVFCIIFSGNLKFIEKFLFMFIILIVSGIFERLV